MTAQNKWEEMIRRFRESGKSQRGWCFQSVSRWGLFDGYVASVGIAFLSATEKANAMHIFMISNKINGATQREKACENEDFATIIYHIHPIK